MEDHEMASKLCKLSDDKLMDVVRNYLRYGYPPEIRDEALAILHQRGIDAESLHLSGKLVNFTAESAEALAKDYNRSSLMAFIFYGVSITSSILLKVSLHSSAPLAWTLLIINLASSISFIIFLIRSFIRHIDFYKKTGNPAGAEDAIVFFLIGMPLYIFVFFFYKNRMKERLKTLR
jgi:hypothetical protein